MNNDTYNGWTNYATWRVHEEYCKAFEGPELASEIGGLDLHEMTEYAKDMVTRFIWDTIPITLEDINANRVTELKIIRGWAHAFTHQVNWKEIAEHLAEAAGIEPRP